MEIIQYTRRLLRRPRWRKRSGYDKLSQTSSTRIVKLGNSSAKPRGGPWRVRLARKLQLARLNSPVRILCRLKKVFMNMRLRIGNGGRPPPMAKSRVEFENRLILEIYKSMVSSLELGYQPRS